MGRRWTLTSEGEATSGGGRMRGSSDVYSGGGVTGWGRSLPSPVGEGAPHSLVGATLGSALTVGGLPTHITLHEGDDPDA